MDLMEAIKGKRVIRSYKPDSVPQKVLNSLVEAVRWAPSWFNTQCWEVIIVRDPKVKSELTDALPQDSPVLSSITEAPILVVLCAKKGLSGYHEGQPCTAKGDWLMFDCGLAMQNLCLAAHALGLGTVIIREFEPRKIAELLNVPQDVEVVAITPLGYPATEENF